MEAKPVRESRSPAYPTRREVLAGAASFALVNLAGCGFVFAEPEADGTIVAPIFAHGDGRGATGCIVVGPPVFLSEEEGMQILREELAKHGVRLKAGAAWEAVRIPARIRKFEVVHKAGGETEFKTTTVQVAARAKPLKPSGVDADKKIAVEFVAEQDYFDLGGEESASTVQGYEFKAVAEQVRTQVKKEGKDRVFFGVFYDPAARLPRHQPRKQGEKVDPAAEWENGIERHKAESKKLLRQQAQDFVAWLKKQKAIQ